MNERAKENGRARGKQGLGWRPPPTAEHPAAQEIQHPGAQLPAEREPVGAWGEQRGERGAGVEAHRARPEKFHRRPEKFHRRRWALQFCSKGGLGRAGPSSPSTGEALSVPIFIMKTKAHQVGGKGQQVQVSVQDREGTMGTHLLGCSPGQGTFGPDVLKLRLSH